MTREITQEQVNDFKASFCPWGYLDIKVALRNYFEAGKSSDELVEAIENFADDVMGTDSKLENIDPVYIAFDTLQQEARTEIENATGKDISNDDPYSGVNVYSNYMATSFDGTDEAYTATKKLIDTMEEKSEVVQWYYDNL